MTVGDEKRGVERLRELRESWIAAIEAGDFAVEEADYNEALRDSVPSLLAVYDAAREAVKARDEYVVAADGLGPWKMIDPHEVAEAGARVSTALSALAAAVRLQEEGK